ncbi:MAG: hypothetical protein ACRDVK_11165 [Acidimicrobiia bacterium]
MTLGRVEAGGMGSTTTYQGRLAVQGDDLDLVVDLRFEDENLEVCTPNESLGRWHISEVQVFQLDSGIFSLRLGTDEALFSAADPQGFASIAITAGSRGRHLRAAVSRNLKLSGW